MKLLVPHPSEVAGHSLVGLMIDIFKRNGLPELEVNTHSEVISSFTLGDHDVDIKLVFEKDEKDEGVTYRSSFTYMNCQGCVADDKRAEVLLFLQKIRDHFNEGRSLSVDFSEEHTTFCWKIDGMFETSEQYYAGIGLSEEFIDSRTLMARITLIFKAICDGKSANDILTDDLLTYHSSTLN